MQKMPVRYVLCVAPVLCVVLTQLLYLEVIASIGPLEANRVLADVTASAAVPPDVPGSEYLWRASYAMAQMFVAWCAVFVLAICATTAIFSICRGAVERRGRIALSVVAGAVFIGTIAAYHALGGELWPYTASVLELMSQTWGKAAPSPEGVVRFMDLLVGVSVVSIPIAMGLAIAPALRDDPEWDRHIEEQCRHVEGLFYLAAILLVVGTVEVYLLHAWPRTLLSEGDMVGREAVDTAAGFQTLMTAACFSLLLLSSYVPAAMILAGRARGLARQKGAVPADETTDAWLEKRGLLLPARAKLTRLVTGLTPLLATGVTPAVLDLIRVIGSG